MIARGTNPELLPSHWGLPLKKTRSGIYIAPTIDAGYDKTYAFPSLARGEGICTYVYNPCISTQSECQDPNFEEAPQGVITYLGNNKFSFSGVKNCYIHAVTPDLAVCIPTSLDKTKIKGQYYSSYDSYLHSRTIRVDYLRNDYGTSLPSNGSATMTIILYDGRSSSYPVFTGGWGLCLFDGSIQLPESDYSTFRSYFWKFANSSSSFATTDTLVLTSSSSGNAQSHISMRSSVSSQASKYTAAGTGTLRRRTIESTSGITQMFFQHYSDNSYITDKGVFTPNIFAFDIKPLRLQGTGASGSFLVPQYGITLSYARLNKNPSV